ncbi:hypothetical protein ARSEF1564_009053 [Beauveria bassiana]
MLFKPLALAAVATAFAIVPEMSTNDENIFKALPIGKHGGKASYGISDSAFDQSISVPCGDCRGRNTRLRLDFTIEDEMKLLLNGFELYPDADPWSGDLQAFSVDGHRKSKSQKLGYSLAVYPKAVAKEDNIELIEVDLKIIEVGTRFVSRIPTLRVELIKAPGGSLAMFTVRLDQPLETPCTTLWCRAKELAGKLWAQAQGMKGCSKAGTPGLDLDGEGMISPGIDLSQKGYTSEIAEPTMPSQEEWRHLMKSVAGHIIMPIFMGVTAGVAVAFLALCIQSMARHLSSFVRGKRNSEQESEFYKAVHDEQATTAEKAQLMA